VANRILAPRSKLATSRWLERVARPDGGEWELDYQHLLRAMDVVAEHQQELEEKVYWQLVDLLRIDLTLVFVDLTSVYVEGEGQSPLWQYGVSKDGKRQNKQLLLALVVTPDGYPLAHFLFPGNRAEKQAVLEMLVELRERYRLQRCVIVGDRGLVSAEVIRALTEAGYEYILALRARQSKTAVAAVEADQHEWEAVDDNLFVQEVEVENADRVLLALNDDKQDVDRRWREQLLERAWEALDALIERWDFGDAAGGRLRPPRRHLQPHPDLHPTHARGPRGAAQAGPAPAQAADATRRCLIPASAGVDHGRRNSMLCHAPRIRIRPPAPPSKSGSAQRPPRRHPEPDRRRPDRRRLLERGQRHRSWPGPSDRHHQGPQAEAGGAPDGGLRRPPGGGRPVGYVLPSPTVTVTPYHRMV
jgi:Transposase DDE domain